MTGRKWAVLLVTAVVSLGVTGLSGCAERVFDCVEVYPNGTVTRLPGYTETACNDHCKQVQGTTDCYWDAP